MAWEKQGNIKGPPGEDGTSILTGATAIVVTTKAAYDALDPPDPDTLYFYPDEEA